MKSILVINDHSPAAFYAAKLALSIAQKMNANLVLLNIAIPVIVLPVSAYEYVPAGAETDFIEYPDIPLHEQLNRQNKTVENFQPDIISIDATVFSVAELAPVVNRGDIWMVIKGIPGDKTMLQKSALHMQAILNQLNCPLMVVPEQTAVRDFKQIIHTIDLRYCKLPVIRFLAALAKPYAAHLLIAHVPMNGLPDMDQSYALTLFNEEISPYVRYDKLYFDHIKEKNQERVFDVLANGMNTDLLAVVNNRFHFDEIIDEYKGQTLPARITIPLLVFPC
jgi:hypothetical protein